MSGSVVRRSWSVERAGVKDNAERRYSTPRRMVYGYIFGVRSERAMRWLTQSHCHSTSPIRTVSPGDMPASSKALTTPDLIRRL